MFIHKLRNCVRNKFAFLLKICQGRMRQKSTFDSKRIKRKLPNIKCLFVLLRGCVYLRFSPFLMGSGQIKEAKLRASSLSQCSLTRDLCCFIQTRFMLFTCNYYPHTHPVQDQRSATYSDTCRPTCGRNGWISL